MRLRKKRQPGVAGKAALEQAQENLAEAQENLAKAQKMWPEVRRVAANLRQLREDNGFGAMIEDTLRGSK